MTSLCSNVEMATFMSLSLNRMFMFLLWCLTPVIEARVVIDSAQPLYVEYGQNLTLTCTSDKGKQLGWIEETRDTGWDRREIEPVLGGRYITRYTIEKPSYLVSSTLIKKDMRLGDRGTYECQDATMENSFGLYVTVIYIATEDVVAHAGEEAVYLYCSIRGFDTNIPYLDYHWYYKEQTIMTNHKYDIVYKEGALQLTVNGPALEDGGVYACSFVLQTNQGPVTFSKDVRLNTDKLIISGTPSLVSSFCAGWSAALALLVVLALSFC